MGRSLQETIEDWSAGVVTNQQVDDIPLNASPRGRNSALISIAGNRASVMKRKGLKVMNTTAITGTPAIIGQLAYTDSADTKYHLLISDGGRLDKRSLVDNTTTAADATATTPFTAGSYYPDSTIAHYLAFFCNGQNVKKFNGTNVQTWGIATPGAAPVTSDPSIVGVMTGTFETKITYYNSTTDHESSPSDASNQTTLSAEQLQVTWAASADAQVSHVRVYVRNTATQPFFYRAATIAIGATTTELNVVTTTLVVKAPNVAQYDPPPSTIQFCEWAHSRMFVSDGVDVWFSELDKPEAFDPDNTLPGVNKEEGQDITGLYFASGVLLIFKKSKTYILIGDHPDNWRVELLDANVGCTSHRSLTTIDGQTRFWSLKGMAEWDGQQNEITPRGQILLSPSIGPEALAFTYLHLAVAAEDPTNGRILFALPALGKTRNTIYIPYNYRLRAFESDQWTAIDAASLCTVSGTDGITFVYAGGYEGQVFRWWDATNDGVNSGTKSGTVTSATTTSLTCSTATFDTTGAGLTDRYVVAIDPAGTRTQRRRIASNTATVLTLASGENFSEAPTSSWTFTVGGIDFAWDTRWMAGDSPFLRKRYRFLYLLLGSSENEMDIDVSMFFDFETTSVRELTTTLNILEEISEWDVAVWDVGEFGSQATAQRKIRIARKGQSWRLRLSNVMPDETVVIHKVGVSSELLTDKDP